MSKKNSLSQDFIKRGYIISKIESAKSFVKIEDEVFKIIKNYLKIKKNLTKNSLFNNLHKYTDINQLNKLRLKIYRDLNSKNWFKDAYFSLASRTIKDIVGNELAIQNNINFSIQCPKDKDSLLPIHADTWDGNSPFELVVWVPMVNCFKTKSMYMLPYQENKKFEKIYKQLQKKRLSVFQALKKKLKWIDINYGEVLIFNLCLPHGNVVNNEKETRWSMNCRFKSLFSPYADKKLGDFFHPLNIKPMTKIGLNYKFIDEKKES